MRHYKRKTDRGTVPLATMQLAANRVIQENQKIRSVANEFGICHVTLYRFVQKLKQNNTQSSTAACGYIATRQVFSASQERMLADYIKSASGIYFGLSPQDVRKLAYECAEKYGIEMPDSWKLKSMAGPDWLSGFLKRNEDLSIRTPEATSLARVTSFNRHNVNMFFDKLGEVMDRHHFEACDIWNFDETGVTTVQKPKKVVTTKGIKQVGAITSAERGVLVTVALSVSADGKAIPPMFVFPRKVFKNHFLNGGPVGCIGVANSSGWMTEADFVSYMHHFIKHTRATSTRPVLLLLDNHCSHLSLDALNLAKENGVVMLSFPPHCSHRLQPLDRSVYGPFKKYVSAAQDGWIRSNPGQTMSIYDIPQIVTTALPSAANAANICSGFKVSGIVPFNRHIFQDSDYLPSSVTDRPNPGENKSVTDTPATQTMQLPHAASTSSSVTDSVEFSPESVRPYPKALPRKVIRNIKRKRQTAILTDTPVKNAIEKEKECSMPTKKRKLHLDDRQTGESTKKSNFTKGSTTTCKSKTKSAKKILCNKTAENSAHDERNCRVQRRVRRKCRNSLPRQVSHSKLLSSSESSCLPRRPLWLDKYKTGE